MDILKEAKDLSEKLTKIYRTLHQNAETGFDLDVTKAIVKEKLSEIGCDFEEKGGGITVLLGKKEGKAFLLRADMDALPVLEESGVDFSCKNGNMHACGHDLHTTMLLGAAEILKKHEDELNGTVKLVFQPAEEILSGSKAMIKDGVLENPEVYAGMMIHVMTAAPFQTGTVIVSSGGITAPSADYFTVKVTGRGCHGSSPHTGVDPINAAAHTVIALEEIISREIPPAQPAALTVGSINGGSAANIIPEEVVLTGSVRCFDEQLREFLKNRIVEISNGEAKTFRAKSEVTFDRGCPALQNDEKVSQSVFYSLKSVLGEGRVYTTAMLSQSSDTKEMSGGSEDFAYFSHEIPTVMIAICAGKKEEGYEYPLHNSKVKFDQEALSFGAAAYASAALGWFSSEIE